MSIQLPVIKTAVPPVSPLGPQIVTSAAPIHVVCDTCGTAVAALVTSNVQQAATGAQQALGEGIASATSAADSAIQSNISNPMLSAVATTVVDGISQKVNTVGQQAITSVNTAIANGVDSAVAKAEQAIEKKLATCCIIS